jgi:hypothetical protein
MAKLESTNDSPARPARSVTCVKAGISSKAHHLWIVEEERRLLRLEQTVLHESAAPETINDNLEMPRLYFAELHRVGRLMRGCRGEMSWPEGKGARAAGFD